MPPKPAAKPDPDTPRKPTHTPEGAPTDDGHAEAGDGTLSGSVPAGLTREQLREEAEGDKTDNSGTG
jgi:hypothetical protein